ncbi:hypothetical protein LUZ60_008410 [Juncus effusus]|nr:hypothetical protein LUZ60_008410 [Juncus effusus]
MLLYGPPGTGKTLIAHQIGKLLNGKEPNIVNGPEVLSKFVGDSEKNVRDLLADSENDQRTNGDQSELHVIIFDEFDAICKAIGSTQDSTGVHDGIVTQLLSKIDGMEALNNVPGRLELHIEIGLPDEKGRLEILKIHTNEMKANSFLAADVNLAGLAEKTKNYSGAELEGVVKRAISYAVHRQNDMTDLTKPLDEESIKVTVEDFTNGLHAVRPAFGTSTDDLERCSGKSSMAATIGIDSNFPYVKIVFEDAYKSELSVVILEDIERLINYVPIGLRFSDLILSTLSDQLKRLPPNVLKHLNVFEDPDIDAAAEALDDMPIKRIYKLVEMAAKVSHSGGLDTVYAGEAKIDLNSFFDILHWFNELLFFLTSVVIIWKPQLSFLANKTEYFILRQRFGKISIPRPNPKLAAIQMINFYLPHQHPLIASVCITNTSPWFFPRMGFDRLA